MKTITFKQLLDFLNDADAITVDGTVTYPVVWDDNFIIDIDNSGDEMEYYEEDFDSISINAQGNIELTKDTDTTVIEILTVKSLLD